MLTKLELIEWDDVEPFLAQASCLAPHLPSLPAVPPPLPTRWLPITSTPPVLSTTTTIASFFASSSTRWTRTAAGSSPPTTLPPWSRRSKRKCAGV